jgi:pyruvate, orthophosphate dikinase
VTYVYGFDHRHDLPRAEIRSLIGGKATNLATMTTELGLPVPPGFTITTEACKAYLAGGWPDGLDDELREHLAKVEAAVGRRFGGPGEPLLLSVRSGAPVSMPGMMDTILNLGLNGQTIQALAESTGDPAFAENCRARLTAMFRSTVGRTEVPEDPWQQLRQAIEAVFRSWNSDRAKTYRSREGIPDDLGTAVTVQCMVFGNRGEDSGTGVLFTRNPATGTPELYGDVMFNAQGEDVVAGTHRTHALAVLDERMPAVATELRSHAATLERHLGDLCDIEFTIERGRLWLLQCRVGKRSPQAALRIAVDMAEDPAFPLSREDAVRRVAHLLAEPPRTTLERPADLERLGTGLAASPGVGTGEIVTSPEAAERVADAGRSVLLVRHETSPDDVHGMARAQGILTAHGGLASHAAVVARGWGIPAVVGAAGLEVGESSIVLGSRTLAVGETITIDGSTGEVFLGAVEGSCEIVPEAATLLSWARDAGIAIVEEGPAPEAEGSATPELVLRTLAIKGFATPEGLAEALMCPPEPVQQIVDDLVAAGLVEPSAGAFHLTPAGKERGSALIGEDRESWGTEAAVAALDAFVALDGRMKETVTAWQMRPVNGDQVFNDHTDPDYDARVLARLAELDADTRAWLEPLVPRLPRLRAYRDRLARAAEHAQTGDHRYVASPRVDSYHSIWFELHEDLIRLAGRSRAEEVAAGRA